MNINLNRLTVAIIVPCYNEQEVLPETAEKLSGRRSEKRCNYIFTSILSFFLNKYFTFSVRHWSAFMIFSFIMTIAVSYLIAYGVSKPIMNYLLRNSPQKICENVALFTGMCLFTGLNYLGQRLVVFKSKWEK